MHEYLIRRRVDGVVSPAWLECGSITAATAQGALVAYGEAHAGELAELATDGEVILEAVSARFRRQMRANPVRQLEIKWGAA